MFLPIHGYLGCEKQTVFTGEAEILYSFIPPLLPLASDLKPFSRQEYIIFTAIVRGLVSASNYNNKVKTASNMECSLRTDWK
jgi:hypothetical protein